MYKQILCKSIRERKARTLDHPLHIALAGLHDALDPLVLPGEELDELDRADELVEHAHALVE